MLVREIAIDPPGPALLGRFVWCQFMDFLLQERSIEQKGNDKDHDCMVNKILQSVHRDLDADKSVYVCMYTCAALL